MKTPATSKETIKLDISQNNGKIDLVPGKNPYLWIGNVKCFGCIPDDQVEKLRGMCNAILERRKLESIKRK